MAQEHERVRAWCEERGFSTSRATSIVDYSANALPGLDGPFDLGLIDGSHSFPMPFIDWYYIARRLRPGGWMFVDDMHIPTCRLLHEFLLAERGRWEHVGFMGRRGSMFRKTGEVVVPMHDWGDNWGAQPWIVNEIERWERPLARLRRVLRPRTRVRQIIARARASGRRE
jgi:hypothetical protein